MLSASLLTRRLWPLSGNFSVAYCVNSLQCGLKTTVQRALSDDKNPILDDGAIVAVALALSGGKASFRTGRGRHDSEKCRVGFAFSEFRGYEGWQVVATSQNDKLVAVILANPVMIEAYLAGIPGNGKPFPDGAKMAKIHWNPKKNQYFPDTTVPGTQHDVDFMVKDSKRFADSGGWGWAVFKYDAASDTFTPGTVADEPPQANDAKCGFACHTVVETRDYVFTITEAGERICRPLRRYPLRFRRG